MRIKIELIIFAALCCLFISSCKTVNIPQKTVTAIMDYTPMTDKGIFVTESNSVDFKYMPLGSVVSITSGAVYSSINTGILSETVNLAKAFEDISNKLVDLGANGIINLKIESTYEGYTHYMTVTGMAIRTKEPILEAKKKKELKVLSSSEFTIDGIKAIIFRRTPTGVMISSDKKMSFEQIIKMAEYFGLTKTPVQVFLANSKDPAYAGLTGDGFYINYETKEFINVP